MHEAQVYNTLKDFEVRLQAFKIEFESVNHSINVFKTQLNEFHKRPDVPADYIAFKATIEQTCKEINEKLGSNSSLIEAARRGWI